VILNYNKELTPLENHNEFFKCNNLIKPYIKNFDILNFINSNITLQELNDFSSVISNIEKEITNIKNEKVNEFLKIYNINATVDFTFFENSSFSTEYPEFALNNSIINFIFYDNPDNSKDNVMLIIHKKDNIIKKEFTISFNGLNDEYHYFKKGFDNCNETNNIENNIFSELIDYLTFTESILFLIKIFHSHLEKLKSILENLNFYKDIFSILKLNNHVKDLNDVKNIIEDNFINYENIKASKNYKINLVNFSINKKGDLKLHSYSFVISKNIKGNIEFKISENSRNFDDTIIINMFKNSLLFENKILKYIGQLEKRGLENENQKFNFKPFIQKYKLKNNAINF